MRLKLACSDFTFPLLSHRQALQIISALGFKGVDHATRQKVKDLPLE